MAGHVVTTCSYPSRQELKNLYLHHTPWDLRNISIPHEWSTSAFGGISRYWQVRVLEKPPDRPDAVQLTGIMNSILAMPEALRAPVGRTFSGRNPVLPELAQFVEAIIGLGRVGVDPF